MEPKDALLCAPSGPVLSQMNPVTALQSYIFKAHFNAGCPTHYRTWHIFNNFTTNEDIEMKLEADLPHCARNVKEKKYCCSNFVVISSLVLELLKNCRFR